MVRGGFARVVSERAWFGHDGIHTRGNHHAAAEPLRMPHPPSLIGDEEWASDVDGKCLCPLGVVHISLLVRSRVVAGGHDYFVEPSVGKGHLLERATESRAVGEVCTDPDDLSGARDAAAGDTNPHSNLVLQ